MGYVNPKVTENDRGGYNITYEEGDKVIETYYGKLTENVVQATARDCLAQAMMRLDACGYDIVFHVHDEAVIEIDEDIDALKDVCDLMGEPIAWAPGLPLRADGYECNFYKKD